MITVLRLGHRIKRDARTTTHLALAARTFHANRMIYSGERDKKLEETIHKLVEKWGGPFDITYEKNWKKIIKEFNGNKIHLSMYGIPFENRIGRIKKHKNLLVIVGGEKVPADVYQLADYNLAIGNQPHSEVSALAIFLYCLKGIKKRFKHAKIKIIPKEKGKLIKT